MQRSVRVLMNEKSGDCAGRRKEIEDAFRARGVACAVGSIKPKMDLAKLGVSPGTIVVAAGGDGTINAVASMLAGTDRCMGVLALGTLNHFAKDLGLPLDLKEAVGCVAEGQPKEVDVAEVNGRIFVNNSSLGFYPGMVSDRERLKRSGWNKWLSLAIASTRGFLRFRQLTVTLTLPPESPGDESRCIRRSTPFVFVGNNEYCLEGSEAGTRVRLDGGCLHLALAPDATRWSLLKLSLAALRRKVTEMEGLHSFCVQEFTVEVNRKVSRVSLDGEVRRMAGRLCYKIRPAALHVMAPASAGDRL